MSDNVKFSLLILLGIVGIYVGLNSAGGSLLGGGTALASVSQSFSGGGSLLASAASVLDGAQSHTAGKFLISFDNLANVHTGAISKEGNTIRVYDVDSDITGSPTVLYVSTNQGMYASYDTGLNWHRVTSVRGEINEHSVVLRTLPVGPHAFVVSVFQNGIGYLYYTPDAFFTMENWAFFEGEGVYDMALYGNTLYLGMSNGQLIAYNVNEKTFRVIHTFASPVERLYGARSGLVYVYLKSGSLLRVTRSGFEAVKIAKGIFSSTTLREIAFDARGTMYALTKDGVYASVNGGKTFVLLDAIPLLKKQVDAIGAMGDTIYVLSAGRLYSSLDGGENWKIQDTIPADFMVAKIYFVGEGRVVLSE